MRLAKLNKPDSLLVLAIVLLVCCLLLSCGQKSTDSRNTTRYKNFATEHYRWDVFMTWWLSLEPQYQASYSHEMPWNDSLNQPIFNDAYYEYIGRYNQFQVGWDDIGPGYPPPPLPGGEEVMSPHRTTYLQYYDSAH